MTLAKKLKKLGAALSDLNGILVKHNVNYSTVVTPIRDKIMQGDISGVKELLRYNGGMGSLNGVYICEDNGHKIAKEDEKQVNEAYLHILESVWKLAKKF